MKNEVFVKIEKKEKAVSETANFCKGLSWEVVYKQNVEYYHCFSILHRSVPGNA